MKTNLITALLCASSISWGQKEIKLSSHPEKVTVFFEGAQIEQSGQVSLSKGRQWVVIEKLTDEMDEASVRVKGKGDFTILSVKSRKNFEDQVVANSELEALNNKKKALEDKQNGLLDQLDVLDFDEGVLNSNYQLKSEKEGINMATLKEASLFFHSKLSEIKQQRRAVSNQLDDVVIELNKVSQEIQARRSKPIINYSEVVVEVDAEATTTGTFELSYITNAASWSPYYDLRADKIDQPIRLESKAKIRQNTGIDWKNVDLVLSTSNPYENSQEPNLDPWYLYYNNYYYQQPSYQKRSTNKDFSGQTIRGQVIDIQTGQALPFCNITIPGTNKIAVTDFDGKFSIDVPEGYNNINAQFVGYQNNYQTINSAYMKLFMQTETQNLKTVAINQKNSQMAPANSETAYGYINGIAVRDEAEVVHSKEKLLDKKMARSANTGYGGLDGETKSSEELQVTAISKDMRMEYVIAEKFTVMADGADHGVNIKTYELQANFEYHSVPKVDPSVYLVAGVYGWEKYNLMSAEANLYFDGTFIGTSNLDPNSTKDTINFSLGKEKGMVITRTNVNELNKEKSVGSRKKVSYNYEIEVRNNKAAAIPLIIKDQFPISQDADIKVRTGKYEGATLDSKTQILTWRLLLKPSEKTVLKLDYDIDFDKARYLRTE